MIYTGKRSKIVLGMRRRLNQKEEVLVRDKLEKICKEILGDCDITVEIEYGRISYGWVCGVWISVLFKTCKLRKLIQKILDCCDEFKYGHVYLGEWSG